MTPTKTPAESVCRANRWSSPQDRVRLNDLSEINKPSFTKEYERIYEPPNLTLKEIRDAIPDELFEKSLFKSLAYLLVNIALCSGTFYAATFINTLPSPCGLVLWPVYWWFQGAFGTGLWVIGHECGHHSFSNYNWINNTIGLILHTGLLVPYHNWRFSHKLHHAQTGNIGEDQVYIPKTRSEIRPHEQSSWQESIQSSSPYVIFTVLSYLLGGWPTYLTFNMSGNRKKYPNFTTHFLPSSSLFQNNQRREVIFSNCMLAAVLAGITCAIYLTSFWTVAKYYLIVYLIVTAWMVCITYLHHTDIFVPHYQPKEWTFVRGALATVDRDYGWFLNTAFHHVHDNHVVHHLFSGMPHYNCVKATPHLKNKIGEYYLFDRTPIWEALYRAAKNCVFVEDEGDVLFYHKK